MTEYLLETASAMIIAFFLDFIFGDPYWMPHPVKAMGKMIAFLERKSEKSIANQNKNTVVTGMFVSIFVVVASAVIVYAIICVGIALEPWIYKKTGWHVNMSLILNGCIFYQLICARALKKETMKIYRCLAKGDIERSRKALSGVVGRDTENLDEKAIVRAACETVSENTSDGIIAPMFYFVIGGAPLAAAYKAVNTLDSMIGYKNSRYILFGRFAAILDDVANWIPARLTGLIMVIASFFCRLNCSEAWRILKRDRKNHSSPNSGYPEAACAGALMIQLGGPSVYSGITVEKPFIGDSGVNIDKEHIKKANDLMYMTSFLFVLFIYIVAIIIG